MDWDWLTGLLTLLFGQVGVLGTVLIGFCGTVLWLLVREQEEHSKTRAHVADLNEKRLELATKTLGTLHGLQTAVDALVTESRSTRSGRR